MTRKYQLSPKGLKGIQKGIKKTHQIALQKQAERIKKYSRNPKKCQNCRSPIPWKKRVNKFCNHSCSAALGNLGVRKHGKAPILKPCEVCKTPTYNKKACSAKCRGQRFQLKAFAKIRNGTYKCQSSRVLRSFLFKTRKYHCEDCKRVTWKNKPIMLTVHHVDGDATNNKLTNLKLYCWNCHSMTENFGNRNKNSTRKYRRFKKNC